MLFEGNTWGPGIGRLSPDEPGGTCYGSSQVYKNHDHGIYLADTDSVTVRADTFVDFERGWAIQRYKSGGYNMKAMIVEDSYFTGANPYRVGHIIIAASTTNARIRDNTFNEPTTAAILLDSGTHTGGQITDNSTVGASTTSGSTTGWTLSGNTES